MKKYPRRYRLLAAARRVADKARDARRGVGDWAERHLGRWNLGFPL